MLLLAGVPAKAEIVTISFAGTYDDCMFANVVNFAGMPTAGLTSIPFSYSLTYDTSLNDPNATVLPTGSPTGNGTTTHDFYGYTLGGLLSVNMALGNLTWNAGDLSGRSVFAGSVGDFWFDTDITLATPTRAWIVFPTSYFFELGGAMGGSTFSLTQFSRIERVTGITIEAVSTTSPMVITSSIPEPSALSLLVAGLGGLAVTRRRKTK